MADRTDSSRGEPVRLGCLPRRFLRRIRHAKLLPTSCRHLWTSSPRSPDSDAAEHSTSSNKVVRSEWLPFSELNVGRWTLDVGRFFRISCLTLVSLVP
jgi:hypothetical protein